MSTLEPLSEPENVDIAAALMADVQFCETAEVMYRNVFRGTSAARVPRDWSARLARSIVAVRDEEQQKRSGIRVTWDREAHGDYDEESVEAELTFLGLLLCRYRPVMDRIRDRGYTFGLDGFQELADAHIEWLESLSPDEIMVWNYEHIRESLRYQGVLNYPFDRWLRMIVNRGEIWLQDRSINHWKGFVQ